MTTASTALSTVSGSAQETRREVPLRIGGDVNLGGESKGVLQSLAEIVKGAAGIVNLEGPVAAKTPAGTGRLLSVRQIFSKKCATFLPALSV
jgi:hypothetical protein